MTQDGLYINHGPNKHALVIIRQQNGRILWLRDFASVQAALDVLGDDVLSEYNRANLLATLAGNGGFFTSSVIEPEDGFAGCSFKRYSLTLSISSDEGLQ